jgi:hypothetical protein
MIRVAISPRLAAINFLNGALVTLLERRRCCCCRCSWKAETLRSVWRPDVLPAVAKEEEERSAWLVLARGPLVRAMAERKPLMLLLLLLLAVPRTLRTRRRACDDDQRVGV